MRSLFYLLQEIRAYVLRKLQQPCLCCLHARDRFAVPIQRKSYCHDGQFITLKSIISGEGRVGRAACGQELSTTCLQIAANQHPDPALITTFSLLTFALESEFWRREWDSNPRSTSRCSTVFKTAVIVHSAIPPRSILQDIFGGLFGVRYPGIAKPESVI
jgi:hypothetical protein